MNTYERIALETKVSNQERTLENLQHRLENATDEMIKALTKQSKWVEGQKLDNLKIQLK